MVAFPAVNELVIKLASRCNIDCSYCYWFNDPLVKASPKFLKPEVVDVLLVKLLGHIRHHQLQVFFISFHGGEPLLFSKERFKGFCQSIRHIEKKTGCQINLSMQSNGLLIDKDWIILLKKFEINLGISLDGDQHLHDKNRIDAKGRGTYLSTIRAIERIRASGIHVYILSVAAPMCNPHDLLEHFVERLELKDFDILTPHSHYESNPLTLAQYYCKLFDQYLDVLIEQDVNIRIFDKYMLQIVASEKNPQHDVGYISTVTLLTDGKLEAIDDLRMIDGLTTSSNIYIQTHDLQQVTEDPLWQEIYYSSFKLSQTCEACEFKKICGGGPMVTRWSEKNRFNNPSVYCEDFQIIISHIKHRLRPHLDAKIPDKEVVT